MSSSEKCILNITMVYLTSFEELPYMLFQLMKPETLRTRTVNLTVRWVSDQYEVHEDFIGMYECEKTDAEAITKIIKDILIRCNFLFSVLEDKLMMVFLPCKVKYLVLVLKYFKRTQKPYLFTA